MTRRTWTLPELRAARDAYMAGRTWDDLGADYGVDANTVRTMVGRQLGKPDSSKRPARTKREDLLLRAIALRNRERLSWRLVCDRVPYPAGHKALRTACVRYCRRHNMALYTGFPDTRLTKWSNA